MSRLSRADLQLQNRAKVLAAARGEFAEHGYRDAKVDGIADRANLTRGAVYSNFPSKRALYFTVLAELSDRLPAAGPGEFAPALAASVSLPHTSSPAAFRQRSHPPRPSAADALSAFAGAWFEQHDLGVGVLPELSELPYAELLGLNALLLGLSLDFQNPGHLGGMIRAARLAVTMLHGARQLTASAPGFVQPLAVARVCAQLADLDLDDPWMPPPSTPPIRPADEPWSPPKVVDAVQRRTADFGSGGVIVVLGVRRLAAAEDAVRTASVPVTIALVSSAPAEVGPFARYSVGSILACLRQSTSMPRIQVVHDESGVLASAVGCHVIGDELEYAARIADGRIVARAEGFGAVAAIAGRAV